MALAMASLKRSTSGGYFARKGIPKDVRAEYQRLYGQAWEAQFTAPPGTSQAKAKAAFNEWLSEIEQRIEGIRAAAKGEGLELTSKQARALAGEWYRWFVGRHENDPGDAERWWLEQAEYVDDIMEFAPSSFRENWRTDPDWNWRQRPEAARKVRAITACAGRTPEFLAWRGIQLRPQATDRFLDAVGDEYIEAVRLLERRAKGDYAPDQREQRFPKLSLVSPVAFTGQSCWQLFEGWVKSKAPRAATVNRWRAVFLRLDQRFQARSAASISVEEADQWKNDLIEEGTRSARTVADVWVMAAKTVFAWGVGQRLVNANPFDEISVAVPKKTTNRENEAFTAAETKLILSAASAITDTRKPFAAACRWVPWICAYTGARSGEITQLRGKDVIEEDDIPAIRLTPEAGTIKTGKPRTVPLHEHLVAQGFLQYVRRKGEGPLFYTPDPKRETRPVDPTRPRRPRAVKARERLAGWVRKVGVTDPEVQPNHAWRDTFKQIAERCGISERTSDQITGHKPKTTGRTYGLATLSDMAEVLKKFPRYRLD